MAEQTNAQKKRAEARERRRKPGSEDQSRDKQDDGAVDHNEEQPLEAVKQAAKVAVAGAAVGAAAAAARALRSRDDEGSEPESPRDESEGDAEETPGPAPEARAEPEDKADRVAKPEDEEEPPSDRIQEPEAQAGSPREEPEPREEERHGAAPDDAKATVDRAREQLEALLDLSVESVSGFERTRNGWQVTLEVVELSRVPESTDVLASYEMELDDDRNLVRYARGHRYYRSQADRGDQT
jgi:hypothetical protein